MCERILPISSSVTKDGRVLTGEEQTQMQKFIRDVLKEKVLDSEPIKSPVAAFALSIRLSSLLS